MTDDQIRETFLANGFTIKEGQTDLKPYVYAAARALLALAASPADRDARDAALWRAHFELMRPETTERGLREYLEAVEAKARSMSATPPAADKE